jgi:hypothetical protein
VPASQTCPKCKRPADPEVLCPHCGFDIPASQLQKGGSSLAGLLTGLALQILLPGLGFLITIVWYFCTYNGAAAKRPFARGLGYSLGVFVALVLGLLAACFGLVFFSAWMSGFK